MTSEPPNPRTTSERFMSRATRAAVHPIVYSQFQADMFVFISQAADRLFAFAFIFITPFTFCSLCFVGQLPESAGDQDIPCQAQQSSRHCKDQCWSREHGQEGYADIIDQQQAKSDH